MIRAVLWAILVTTFLTASPNHIEVQGGNIYTLNLNTTQAADKWVAFYGRVSAYNNATSATLLPSPYNASSPFDIPPRVYPLDVYYAPSCLVAADYIFATNFTGDIQWDRLTNVSSYEVDAYFGIGNNSIESTSGAFDRRENVSLGAYNFSNLLTTELLALNHTNQSAFIEYALKDNVTGALVFGVPLFYPLQEAFDGTYVNYQILLPRGPIFRFLSSPTMCAPTPVPFYSNTGAPASDAVSIKTAAVLPENSITSPPPKLTEIEQISEQSVFNIEHLDGKTRILVYHLFDSEGIQDLAIEYPIPYSLFEQGQVIINLEKLPAGSRVIQTLLESQTETTPPSTIKVDFPSQLFFADSLPYRASPKGNGTLVVWTLDVKKGDAYVAKADLLKILPTYFFKGKIKITVSKTSPSPELLASHPKSQLKQGGIQFFVQQLSPVSWFPYFILALLLTSIGYFYFRRPWVLHYIGRGHFGVVYHFFVKPKLRPFVSRRSRF